MIDAADFKEIIFISSEWFFSNSQFNTESMYNPIQNGNLQISKIYAHQMGWAMAKKYPVNSIWLALELHLKKREILMNMVSA